MNLEHIKKQWKSYNDEFDNSDYMDVETHVSMAMRVGELLDSAEQLEKIKKLSKEVEDMSLSDFAIEVLRIIEGKDIPSRKPRA